MPQSTPRSEPLRQQIFEHVRATGHAARSDITRALDISPASVTALTADLIRAGLLREVDGLPRESGRGRPPVALEVIPESHLVIGVKLGDERHSAVLTDFAGQMLADATMAAAPGRKSVTALLDELEHLLDALLVDHSLSDISAIAIGIAGIVEHQTGTLPWCPLLIDKNVELGARVSERFGLPAYIDNDANMLTLAELWFGTGRAMPDFAVVTVEHGVGMGLVLGNRLYRGGGGMGMELGHIKVQLDGALCRCGRRGCLEAYLADYALVREAATAMGDASILAQPPGAALEKLFAEAKSGNEAARSIFRRAGRYLSIGLANVIQLFDPAQIILAGERMQFDYLYADTVMREMQELTLSEGRKPCKVATHAWGDLVWARGATALALSAVTESVLGSA